MKKKISILVVTIMMLTSVIGGVAAPIFASDELPEENTRERIFGNNRYETAYEIAKDRYEQMDTVIIVRGDEEGKIPQVADALAASGLAGALEAPILLAHNQRLTGATTDAIKEMNPSKAVVVGGEQALSSTVIEELEELDVAVERIFGDNRYESAVEVAKKANREVDKAIIVNGHALVDSLVAGPFSHQTGYPILLVQQDRVPGATEAVLSDYDEFIIVGQEAVVSAGVEEELKTYGAVERVGGENREETSVLFAERFMGGSQKPSVVNGRDYADAVAASILEEAILYLDLRNERTIEHQLNTAAKDILQGKALFRTIGGNAVISDAVFDPVHKEEESKEPELPEEYPEIPRDQDALIKIDADPDNGFNWDYYLYIPQNVDENATNHLLVEPNNTGTISDDINFHDERAQQLLENQMVRTISDQMQTPALVPVFPRPESEPYMYTHSLDRQTLLKDEGDLERIDLQLKEMIRDAQGILRANHIQVEDKVWMNGYSASGDFATRFPILHPDIIQASAGGGVNGILTFPMEELEGENIRYPVGTGDFDTLLGQKADLEAFKEVPIFTYMGYLDKNDTTLFRDAFDVEDADYIRNNMGEDIMERWEKTEEVFYENDFTNVQFHTYNGKAHVITKEMMQDVIQFFEANKGDEVTHIEAHQYDYIAYEELTELTITDALWSGNSGIPGFLTVPDNNFIIFTKEWMEGQDYQQMSTFLNNLPQEGYNITLQAPDKPDVNARLTGRNFSANPQGFFVEVPGAELANMERGVEYTLHPKKASDTYFFSVAEAVTLTRP